MVVKHPVKAYLDEGHMLLLRCLAHRSCTEQVHVDCGGIGRGLPHAGVHLAQNLHHSDHTMQTSA